MNPTKGTKFFTLTILFTLFAATILLAQTSVKEKLDGIKGDVNKITISTASGDVVFEGDDAAAIFKKLKEKKIKKIQVTVDDDNLNWIGEDDMIIEEIDDANILKFIGEDGDSTNIFLFHDGDDVGMEMKKKIIVSEEDGVKKVTVTTTEDGVEEVKVYEGNEADEFLKSMEKKHDLKIWSGKGEKGKKMKKIIIKK